MTHCKFWAKYDRLPVDIRVVSLLERYIVVIVNHRYVTECQRIAGEEKSDSEKEGGGRNFHRTFAYAARDRNIIILPSIKLGTFAVYQEGYSARFRAHLDLLHANPIFHHDYGQYCLMHLTSA